MDLSELKEVDILDAAPPSLREAFVAFGGHGITVDAAGVMLVNSQYIGVTLKGGAAFPGNLWKSLKGEFREFLCDSGGKYDELRKKCPKVTKQNQAMVIAHVSGVIGGFLGVQAGIVSPLVLWLLLVAVRIGKESLCAALGEADPAPVGEPKPVG